MKLSTPFGMLVAMLLVSMGAATPVHDLPLHGELARVGARSGGLAALLPSRLLSRAGASALSHKRRSSKQKRCTASSSSTTSTAAPTATLTPPTPAAPSSCFPALDFTMPSDVPSSLDGWWCSKQNEYAYLGFSYDTSSCPSASDLVRDFTRQRKDFNARYVRLYSACDRAGFNDDLINAAWSAGIGIMPLVWFGFDGSTTLYKTRINKLVATIKRNPKAPFVVRSVTIGSEPLFDWAIGADDLAATIVDVRKQLSPWTGKEKMQVTTSEMPYGYTIHGDAPRVFQTVSVIQGNILPFFDSAATTAKKSWGAILWNYNYLIAKGRGKKIYFTQTGWPSNDDVWKANSKNAVASVTQMKNYFELLDSQCAFFKAGPQGGVGWFAHIYSDNGLPGWGVLDSNLNPKFDFNWRTSC